MKNVVFGVLLSGLATGANALEYNWYLKTGYGYTNPDAGDLEKVISDELGVEKKFSDGNGFSFALGYQLNRFIALEAGAAEWGDASLSDSFNYGNLEVDGYEGVVHSKAKLSGSTATLGAVLSTSVDRPVAVGLKGGVHFWSVKQELRSTDRWSQISGFDADGNPVITNHIDQLIDVSENTDGSDPYVGLIASYREDGWVLSIEYTQYQTENADPTSSVFSVSRQF